MKSIRHSYLPLLVAFIIIISCQREVNFQGPIDRVVSFDSAQLVKSIQLTYNSGTPQNDSITESYSYDTTNRTITVSWDSATTDLSDLNGSKAVYTYNTHGLLTGITYHYANTYTPWDGDYTTISISYDNQDVLKQVVLHFVAWPTLTKNYVKTATASGYKLEWDNVYADPTNPPVNGRQTEWFDQAGKCLKYERTFIDTDMNGNPYTGIAFSDSLVYDGSGDLQKVYNYEPVRLAPQPNFQILRYQFESRFEKGDQLGKQRQLLFKGLENMQFDEGDDWFYTSILNDTPDPYEFNQFTTYPIKTAKVYNIDTNVQVPFTAEASFDATDRLLSFKGFFDDGPLKLNIYKLRYYK